VRGGVDCTERRLYIEDELVSMIHLQWTELMASFAHLELLFWLERRVKKWRRSVFGFVAGEFSDPTCASASPKPRGIKRPLTFDEGLEVVEVHVIRSF
jgi:hypothetical protein